MSASICAVLEDIDVGVEVWASILGPGPVNSDMVLQRLAITVTFLRSSASAAQALSDGEDPASSPPLVTRFGIIVRVQ